MSAIKLHRAANTRRAICRGSVSSAILLCASWKISIVSCSACLLDLPLLGSSLRSKSDNARVGYLGVVRFPIGRLPPFKFPQPHASRADILSDEFDSGRLKGVAAGCRLGQGQSAVRRPAPSSSGRGLFSQFPAAFAPELVRNVLFCYGLPIRGNNHAMILWNRSPLQRN